jgi:uncharacterized protein (UPF0212 family)
MDTNHILIRDLLQEMEYIQNEICVLKAKSTEDAIELAINKQTRILYLNELLNSLI